MKKSLLFFAGLLILLFTGCSEVDDGMRGQTGNNETLSFTLNIKGAAVNTYATVPAIGGEDEVHTLQVLFFEPSINGSGKFIEMVDVSPPDETTYKSGQTIELNLPSGSSLSKSEAYSLLFVANAEFYLGDYDWEAYLTDKTEAEVRILRVGVNTNNEATPADASYYEFTPYPQDNLLMTGSINKEAGDELITVEITRLVSRFDVVNATVGDYTLVSASVWNAFPTEILWDGNYTDFSVDRIKRLYGMELENDEVKGGLYAYENYVAVPEQNDEMTTCIILGILHDSEVSYYRVNACASVTSQQLRRNNVYTFNIINVKGKGENSEEDAYKSPKNLLQIQINEWNVDDQGSIVFDGDNILAISTNDVRFNRLGGDREYKVFTAGEGTLQIINQELPSGFTVTLVDHMLYISATPSDIDKAGYIELQFGKLTTTMRITQTGELEEYLELTHMELPIFENEANLESEDVIASSSGGWTAKLYNDDDIFVFESTGTTTMTGANGTAFKIKTLDYTRELETQYAFVHVVLDSNPKISAVVIISQHGMGGIRINPDGELVYEASGDYKTMESDYLINVETEDDEEWEVALYGAYKDYFDITKMDSNNNGTDDQVLIKPSGENPEPLPITAQGRIYLKRNPAIYKEITVTQEAYTLTVTPETTQPVPTAGGTTDKFTVTAGKDWIATIEVNGNTATFGNGSDTMTGTAGESDFTITMPELEVGGITPEVTITIKLVDTNIEKKIVITQRELTGKVITIQNSNYWYGYMNYLKDNDPYRINYVEQMYQSMIDISNFGPNGAVFSGGVNFLPYSLTPADDTDLYIMNCFSGSTTQGTDILTWWNNPNRLILALADDRTSTLISSLRLTGYTGTGGTGNNVIKTDVPRSINTGSEYTVSNNKLYEYLLKTGPFTNGVEIQKDQIKLLAHDASNNCLTSWPSTMIPLMLDPHDNKRLLMGIDPVLRLVYVGELDIFTTVGVDSISYDHNGTLITGNENYQNGPYSEYNLKFLNNLIAWMFRVIIEGDDFTNIFIQ